jgi:osmotically inducible lipoprotein OsmB
MAFIDAAIAVGAAVGLEGTAAAIGGGALMAGGAGALAGGLYNGLTGRSVLNGALIGGAIGGIGGATAGYGLAPGFAATADATAVGMGFSSAAEAIAANPANATLLGFPAGTTAAQAAAMGGQASTGFLASGMAPGVAGGVPAAATPVAAGNQAIALANASNDPIAAMNAFEGWTGQTPVDTFGTTPAQDPSLLKQAGNWVAANPGKTAAGLGAAYLLSQGKKATQPNYLPAYTPPSAASYGLGATLSPYYRPTRPMAEGGLAALASGGRMINDPVNVDFMGGDMYPQSQIHRSYYATPTQMPTSAQQVAASYEPKTNPLTGEMAANMAAGGITAAGQTGLISQPQSMNPQYIQQLANQFNTTPEIAQQGLQALQTAGIAKATGGSVGSKYNLGSYSDGGRLLKGPGDGMSDNIPASIADKQPARLADGEFVVPADVVSHLGNGSTDAGAKHLYKMMDNVRKARTGRKSQGKQIKADKYLPK